MSREIEELSTTVQHGALFRMACSSACLVALFGCENGKWGTVTGRVTVAGRGLTEGRVVFRSATTTLDGPITPDGRFRLTWKGSPRVPAGDYAVILLPPEWRSTSPPATEERSFPERLRTAETSGVKHAIPPGDSTIDIDFGPISPPRD